MDAPGREARRDDVEQVGAVEGHMRRAVELLAQRIERRTLQGAPVLPAPLVGDNRAHALAVEPCGEAQPAQDAHRIRAHVDAAADLGELGRLLVDVDLEPGSAQRQRGGEAADAAADHRDPERCAGPLRKIFVLVHGGLVRVARLGAINRQAQPVKERLRGGGSADLGTADEVDKAIALRPAPIVRANAVSRRRAHPADNRSTPRVQPRR